MTMMIRNNRSLGASCAEVDMASRSKKYDMSSPDGKTGVVNPTYSHTGSDGDVSNRKAKVEKFKIQEPNAGDANQAEEGKKSEGNVCTSCSRYPKSVYFIIGNEFCERFSYYGMRAVLVIFLTRQLFLTDDTATAIYHGFIVLCYFSPLLGAFLADGFLGKFKTIFYISLIYAAGNIVMAGTSVPPTHIVGPMVGLALIGIGTGGIKPCVSAFGGDQFSKGQEKELLAFFSIFYFAINAGSVLSTFITPIFRADVSCFGQDCYLLAYGVPAVLMIISLFIFVSGFKMYKKYPPTGNLMGKIFKCILYGIKKKFQYRSEVEKKRDHWLDYTTDKYDEGFVDDVKSLLKVLFMYLPLPVFWALFDQQGSRWTLQAEQMNGDLGVLGTLEPDQVQVINPILILIFIPIFDNIIYPLLGKCKIPMRPLQRMAVGMLLAAASFGVSGFIQIKLDETIPAVLQGNSSSLNFINAVHCPVTVQSDIVNATIKPYGSLHKEIPAGNYSLRLSASCLPSQPAGYNVELINLESYRLVLMDEIGTLSIAQIPEQRKREKTGKAAVSVIALLRDIEVTQVLFTLDEETANVVINGTEASKYNTFKRGSYKLQVVESLRELINEIGEVELGYGGVYTLILLQNNSNNKISPRLITGIAPSSLSMLLQFPQYMIITAGEVMFSITGLSFSYSQAPVSMKSVIQAGWLMTVAFGNLLVLIITQVDAIPNQVVEFFVFAVLMIVTTVIFVIMSMFYKYVTHIQAGTGNGDNDDDKTESIAMPKENRPMPVEKDG